MKKYKKIKIGKEIIKAEICNTIFKKARGLMFRKSPGPLFFVFNTPTRQPIHSFFCKHFRAVWIKNGKIIDDKIVHPWKFSVKPKENFTDLLEIPL